jgi:hypothetical protein
VVQIARRKVIDVLLLQDPTQEVDRLVERVESVDWVKLGPKRFETLRDSVRM